MNEPNFDFPYEISRLISEEFPNLNEGEKAMVKKGVILALKPFGVFDSDFTPKKSESALRFLQSYFSVLEKNITLIKDWERIGSTVSNSDFIFNKGIRFLRLIELERSKSMSAKPILNFQIVKAIIRKKDSNGEFYYLTHLDDKSHYYQMIGGRIRANENPKDALLREIYEEIPNFNLRVETDFKIFKIEEMPIYLKFVSPKYGCLTEYEVNYFMTTFSKEIPLSGSLRWISHSEYLNESTEDGFKTIPGAKDFENMLSYVPNNYVSFGSVFNKEDLGEQRNRISYPIVESNFASNLFGSPAESVDPKKCFIIMPYSQSWSESVQQLIEEVANGYGLNPIIAKNMHGRVIPNDIWKGITGAGVIIADITDGNPNVTYEVGLADVLEKPIILLSQNEDVPFDFRSQRLILYKDTMNGSRTLKKNLEIKIKHYLEHYIR